MSDVAIRVENLSKTYRLGTRSGYHRLSEALYGLGRAAASLPGRLRRQTSAGGGPSDDFRALKDVSFEVRRGEVVGIIGRNGAGKSTLLKILSRITEPTTGRVGLRGRVGSLLEVGTGFHPELTGRENISLNGAVLGMSRAEIRRRFDEIVAFAELEQFLDTPVKRYSSGMYVRLAFAVAAHLEPEILIVDEVLAVGDAQFQKKCLGKLGDVAKSGRTVLFVSHHLAAISTLCQRGVLLREGRVASVGDAHEVVQQYLAGARVTSERTLQDRGDRRGDGRLRFVRCRLEGAPGRRPHCQGPARLLVEYVSRGAANLRDVDVSATVHDSYGRRLLTLASLFSGGPLAEAAPCGTLECRIGQLPLAPGRYSLHLWAAVRGDVADFVEDALEFEVEPDARTGAVAAEKHGPLVVPHEWRPPEVVTPQHECRPA